MRKIVHVFSGGIRSLDVTYAYLKSRVLDKMPGSIVACCEEYEADKVNEVLHPDILVLWGSDDDWKEVEYYYNFFKNKILEYKSPFPPVSIVMLRAYLIQWLKHKRAWEGVVKHISDNPGADIVITRMRYDILPISELNFNFDILRDCCHDRDFIFVPSVDRNVLQGPFNFGYPVGDNYLNDMFGIMSYGFAKYYFNMVDFYGDFLRDMGGVVKINLFPYNQLIGVSFKRRYSFLFRAHSYFMRMFLMRLLRFGFVRLDRNRLASIFNADDVTSLNYFVCPEVFLSWLVRTQGVNEDFLDFDFAILRDRESIRSGIKCHPIFIYRR